MGEIVITGGGQGRAGFSFGLIIRKLRKRRKEEILVTIEYLLMRKKNNNSYLKFTVYVAIVKILFIITHKF